MIRATTPHKNCLEGGIQVDKLFVNIQAKIKLVGLIDSKSDIVILCLTAYYLVNNDNFEVTTNNDRSG